MSKYIENLKVTAAKIAENGGKPISQNSVPGLDSLYRRGLVNCGHSNEGSVAWITSKGFIALEDAEE